MQGKEQPIALLACKAFLEVLNEPYQWMLNS